MPKESIVSLASLKDKTTELFNSANRSIQLYTHNLDPRILNNREIEKSLTLFAKKSRASQLQILIYQEQLMQGIDHRLVALAQRFPSYVAIKVIEKDHHENPFGYYLVDGKMMIYRSNVDTYDAESHSMPSFMIKDKAKLFDTIWQSSTPASFLRALYL